MKGHIPIIALTAFVTPEAQRACEASGMTDFLPKPLKLAGASALAQRRRWQLILLSCGCRLEGDHRTDIGRRRRGAVMSLLSLLHHFGFTWGILYKSATHRPVGTLQHPRPHVDGWSAGDEKEGEPFSKFTLCTLAKTSKDP